ncbi:unnamed protein product [Pedinophyceae sp. YPF-701]|nr:unnamed protein product [Pedinophyceae sp. YPF-701]
MPHSSVAEEAVFGVLFTLSKEKYNTSWKFALLDIILNWVQLLLLVLSGVFPWDMGEFGEVANNLGVPELMKDGGYAVFNATFYVLFAVTVVSVALCGWVAHNFVTNRFPFVWPIKVLRFVVSIFFRTFYITVLNVFAIGPDCRNVGGDLVADIFPDKKCFGLPHGITALLAILAGSVGGAISFLMAVAESSLDPMTEEVLGSPDSVTDVRFFSLITVVTVLSVFLDHNIKAFAIIMLIASTGFVYLMLRKAPYYYKWVNALQTGLYGTIFWTSLCLAVLVFLPEERSLITVAMYAGFGPSFFLFGALMLWRLRSSEKIADRFHAETSLFNYEFIDEWSVELASRCMRRRDQYGNVQEDWIEAAERIVRAGLFQFPVSSYLMQLNANFLLSAKKASQAASAQINQVRQLTGGMPMGEQFQLFCRDREMKQRNKGSGTDSAMDLVSYVEFQNSYAQLLHWHSGAMKSVRGFWRTLLRPDLTFRSLSHSFSTLAMSSERAEKVYASMLERYPRNVKLLRAYGKFLDDLKNDPWKAARYYGEADKIEDMQAEAQRDAIFGDMSAEGDASAAVVDDTKDAVVVISDTGIIQMANRILNKLFGYKVGELEGMNVSCLMPQPFSGQHNGYLRNYKLTGKSKVLGKVREVIALHKSGSVMPVQLAVTKVPSDGQDAFMGVIRSVNDDLSCGTAWLTAGAVFLAANRGFADNFGYSSKDVVDKSIFMIAPSDSSWDMEIARCAEEASNISDDAEEELQSYKYKFEAAIRHKYANIDVAINVIITLAGTRAQRILVCHMYPKTSKDGILVVNTAGEIVYANAVAEKIMDYKPGFLLESEAKISSILPSPYGQVHMRCMRNLGNMSTTSAPCFAGRPTMLLGRHHKQYPVKMSWRPVKDGESLVLVAVLSGLPVPPSNDWAQGGPEEALHLPMRTRILVTDEGEIVAGYGGMGYKYDIPGAVLGVNCAELTGRLLSEHVDVIHAAVRNAQLYGKVDPKTVVGPFIKNLLSKSRELDLLSWRVGFMPDPGKEDTCVTIALTVQSIDRSAVNVNALELETRYRQELSGGRGYVIDLWRYDLLEASLETDKNFIIRSANLHAQLMFGYSSASVFGKPLSMLLPQGSSATAQLRAAATGGRAPAMELAHADTGAIKASMAGAPKKHSSDKFVVLFRDTCSVAPETLAPPNTLRRIEGLFAKEGLVRQGEPMKRQVGGVRFAAELEERFMIEGRGKGRRVGRSNQELRDAGESDEETDEVTDDDDDDDDDDAKPRSKPGDENESEASSGGSMASAAMSEATTVAQVQAADFRRAKRYKRIHRALSNSRVTRLISSLQLKSKLLLLTLAVIYAAISGTVIGLSEEYKRTFTLALEAVQIGEEIEQVAVFSRSLQSVRDGTGWAASLETSFKTRLDTTAERFWGHLRDSYIEPRQRNRVSQDVIDVFEEPHFPLEWFDDTNLDPATGARFDETRPLLVNQTRIVGFLKLAQFYTLAAREMRTPPARFQGAAAGSLQMRDFRHFQIVQANVHGGMLDGFREYEVAQGQDLSNQKKVVQNFLLAAALISSIGLIPIVTFALLSTTLRLVTARLKLLRVFLQVPRPVLIALATQDIGVEEDDEDVEGAWRRAALTEEEKEMMEKEALEAKKRRKRRKRGVSDTASVTGGGAASAGPAINFMANTQELSNNNWRLVCVLTLPMLFLMGACLGMHLGARAVLDEIDGKTNAMIAAEDMLQQVARMVENAQELVLADPTVADTDAPGGERWTKRRNLNETTSTFEGTWDGIIFGDASKGLDGDVIAASEFQSLLFDADQCLRANASSCLATDHPFYEELNNGLDQAIRAVVNAANLLGNSALADPDVQARLDDPHFQLLWVAGLIDARDGLSTISKKFNKQAEAHIVEVEAIEGALFGLGIIFIACYFRILKPYTKSATEEGHYVSELLSQLPEEMDVIETLKVAADIEETAGVSTPWMVRFAKSVRHGAARIALGRALYDELEDVIRAKEDEIAEESSLSLLANSRWAPSAAAETATKGKRKKKKSRGKSS